MAVNLIELLRGIESGASSFGDTKLDRHLDDATARVIHTDRPGQPGQPGQRRQRRQPWQRRRQQERGRESRPRRRQSAASPQQPSFELAWGKHAVTTTATAKPAAPQQPPPLAQTALDAVPIASNALSLIEDTAPTTNTNNKKTIARQPKMLPMLTYETIANVTEDARPGLYNRLIASSAAKSTTNIVSPSSSSSSSSSTSHRRHRGQKYSVTESGLDQSLNPDRDKLSQLKLEAQRLEAFYNAPPSRQLLQRRAMTPPRSLKSPPPPPEDPSWWTHVEGHSEPHRLHLAPLENADDERSETTENGSEETPWITLGVTPDQGITLRPVTLGPAQIVRMPPLPTQITNPSSKNQRHAKLHESHPALLSACAEQEYLERYVSNFNVHSPPFVPDVDNDSSNFFAGLNSLSSDGTAAAHSHQLAMLSHLVHQVDDARIDSKLQAVMQRDMIAQMTAELPESYIATVPALRSETHVRAMQKIVDYVWAYYLRAFMRPAWQAWRHMVQTFIARQRFSASITIQRCVARGTAGRLRTAQRRREMRDKILAEWKALDKRVSSRRASAMLIQRVGRGYILRIWFRNHVLIPRQAVVCISRFWRSLAAGRMLTQMRAEREERDSAAATIQRCWCGYRGRKMFWEKLRQSRIRQREEHLLDKRWVIRHDFEKRGALLKLQRWWRAHLNRKHFAKRLLKRLRQNMAISIQAMWRSWALGKRVGQRKVAYLMKHKTTPGDWVTMGRSHVVTRWGAQALAAAFVQRGTKRHLKRIKRRKDKENGESRIVDNTAEEDDDNAEGGDADDTTAENVMAKLGGFGSSMATKLRLKKWRRRADETLDKKHARLAELQHPLEQRALVYPFEAGVLRACANRDLNQLQPRRQKHGLRRLVRALWCGESTKLAERAQWHAQTYFHTKRNGDTEMRKLMQRREVTAAAFLTGTDGGVSDVVFWEMLGSQAFDIWQQTHRPITLSVAALAYKRLFTFREGANSADNLLQAARVCIACGKLETALQYTATCVLEFPGAKGGVLPQVIFLSAMIMRRLGMPGGTIIEYLVSLIADVPIGLSDDHVLLQLARAHAAENNMQEASAASLEIFSTQKRRRQLPKGVGTSNQYYGEPCTWISFCDAYLDAGYTLAALDAATEALRLAQARQSNIHLGNTFHDHHVNEEGGGHKAGTAENPNPDYVDYEPKEGYTIDQCHAAAVRIQSRFRTRRGQLAFHLKRQAMKALVESLPPICDLGIALWKVGVAMSRTGDSHGARKHFHRAYVLIQKSWVRLNELNLLHKKSPPAIVAQDRGDAESGAIFGALKKNDGNEYDKVAPFAEKIMSVLAEVTVELSRLRTDPSRLFGNNRAREVWRLRESSFANSEFYSALHVQCAWRSSCARAKSYERRLDFAARAVQHLWLNRHEIKAFRDFRKRMWAVKVVQRAWRDRMARMILTMVHRRRAARQRIYRSMGERGIRRKLAVRAVSDCRDRARRNAEQVRVGRNEFRRTVMCVADSLLLDGKDDRCELRLVFHEFTTEKVRPGSPTKELEGGREQSPSRKQSKKDVRQLEPTIKNLGFKNFLAGTAVLTSKLTMVAADIAFAKAAAVHSASPNVLPYRGFVEVLRILARERYPDLVARLADADDGQNTPSRAKRKSKKKKKKRQKQNMTTKKGKHDTGGEDGDDAEETREYRWRCHGGDSAILLKLLHECVFCHAPSEHRNSEDGSLMLEPMGATQANKSMRPGSNRPSSRKSAKSPKSPKSRKRRKSQDQDDNTANKPPDWNNHFSMILYQRAEEVATLSVCRIQGWVRCQRALADSLGRRMARLKRENVFREGVAATVIQAKLMRPMLARRRVVQMARATLTKWIDYNTGAPYWCSPKTNHTFWTKPLILGRDDVRHVVQSPHPLVEYTLSCSDCQGTAFRYCHECDEWFCKECYSSNHSKGKRAMHTFLDMDPCVECGYQIASRFCDSCGDNFCDSCYYAKHQRGRMRLHTWEAIIPMCECCDERTGTQTGGSSGTAAASGAGETAAWYMLDEAGETLGPFSLEVMIGLFRSKRIKKDGMVCMPPSKQAAAAGEQPKWVSALAAGLHKHGIKPVGSGASSGGGNSSIAPNSALREIFAARVKDLTHEHKMICNICRDSHAHSSCHIDTNVPVGTKATLEKHKAEQQAAAEALAEEVKRHEREMAAQRRRVGAAGRIQGWWRGYLGRQWGKRYMSRMRNKRRGVFEKAAAEHRRRRRLSNKLWRLGKCLASTPGMVVRMVKGPGLTEEQQKEKDEDMAEIKIRKLLNNRFALRFPGEATIKPDSSEVLLSEIEWSSQKVIDGGAGERKVQRRDRIRFQVGLEMLGDDDFDNFEFAFEAADSQNEFLATLSKPIEGEWDPSLPVRVWWSPPITDEEIKERHSMMKRKKMMEDARQEKLAKRQMQAAAMAERLGEDSKMAKRLKKAAGIMEEDDDDEDDEDDGGGGKSPKGATQQDDGGLDNMDESDDDDDSDDGSDI